MVVALSDPTIAVLIAVCTLGGACAGGWLAARATLRVEEERRAEQEVSALTAARGAARLVRLELENAHSDFTDALAPPGVWRATQHSTRAWHEQRMLLASVLRQEHWLAVAQGVGAVDWERDQGDEVGEKLAGDRRTSVEESRKKVADAINSLESFEGQDGPDAPAR